MNVELIVDSTVDVPEHIRSRLTVVPLTIHFGQEEYLDGVTMDKHRFYERLVESDVLPTTSQASPAAFDREFRRVRRTGGSAVVLTIAAGLSGTYQSACIAAAEYDNIYVVDSGTAAIGAGIGPCCFETDGDVPQAMRAALGAAADPYIEQRGAKWHVDLKGINAHWLRADGVEQIDVCAHCTACRPDLYWSHRRMGNARGAQIAMIALR